MRNKTVGTNQQPQEKTESVQSHSLHAVVIPARRLQSGQVVIQFGNERRRTTLYKKKNGSYVYWSPFTRERIVIKRPIKRLWEACSIRELEARLEKSRKCPERESRYNVQSSGTDAERDVERKNDKEKS